MIVIGSTNLQVGDLKTFFSSFRFEIGLWRKVVLRTPSGSWLVVPRRTTNEHNGSMSFPRLRRFFNHEFQSHTPKTKNQKPKPKTKTKNQNPALSDSHSQSRHTQQRGFGLCVSSSSHSSDTRYPSLLLPLIIYYIHPPQQKHEIPSFVVANSTPQCVCLHLF